MTDYKAMYLLLFNAVTDALEKMDRQNYGEASALQRLLIPDSYMSSGLAEGIRPFVDDETLAEAEELYMDSDGE